MKFSLKENMKSLYEEYLILDENKQVKYKAIGKKEVDEILEIYYESSYTEIKLKKLNYFGVINFEIYFGEELITTIGEEINLFKDVFYFNFNGWKLTSDEENMNYIVTDINDENIFILKKPKDKEREDYELEVYNSDDILGAITISLVMYVYDKKNIRKD